MPLVTLLGDGNIEGLVRACTSINKGLLPSRVETTTEPTAPGLRSDRKLLEGSSTSMSPRSTISNTPTSLVDPKRFFAALSRRQALIGSPSMWSTASTMCSSIRGPAMSPPLVT